MSFVTKGGGVSNLSGLTIDVDKDWAGKGISNLKELALAMAQGDLIVRGPAVLQRLIPGIANTMLTSAGPGALPFWGPGGTYLNRYIPAEFYLGAPGFVIVPVAHTQNIPTSVLTTAHNQAYLDDVAHNIKQLNPTITVPDAEAIVPIDQTDNEPAPIASEGGAQMLIDGAVADDGGALTDETAAARSGAANDMTLLPAAPAVGDAYMLGALYPAQRFWINIGVAGAGNWTLVMKYWNGAAWTATIGEIETSNQFQASGMKYWQHVPQGDWALHVVSGMNLYWVRIEVTNFVNIVTQPKGTQSWWEALMS